MKPPIEGFTKKCLISEGTFTLKKTNKTRHLMKIMKTFISDYIWMGILPDQLLSENNNNCARHLSRQAYHEQRLVSKEKSIAMLLSSLSIQIGSMEAFKCIQSTSGNCWVPPLRTAFIICRSIFSLFQGQTWRCFCAMNNSWVSELWFAINHTPHRWRPFRAGGAQTGL